ncbi:MAG: DUF2809 domain-containing protein [Synechococcales bacterium]|nr:DUF2809 domain-containing protein [Synechococcales bacterium]
MPRQSTSHSWLRFNRFRFNRLSFILFVILFAIEVIIAVFFRDPWIRHFLGDVLVVMVIAYFIHAFLAVSLRKIAIGTLIFAYFVEFLQVLNLIDRLGWRDSQLAHLTIGSTFDWRDLVAYTIGTAIVLMTSR